AASSSLAFRMRVSTSIFLVVAILGWSFYFYTLKMKLTAVDNTGMDSAAVRALPRELAEEKLGATVIAVEPAGHTLEVELGGCSDGVLGNHAPVELYGLVDDRRELADDEVQAGHPDGPSLLGVVQCQ